MNLGDIATSQVLYFHFTTRQFSTGTPITAASLVVSVYKDDNTTESTAGITTTYTTGFDSRVGLVSVKVDTSSDGTFYAAGHDFSVVITAGTADSVSIIGEVVGYFSIQNRSALRPATAGRTLVVDSAGLADANTVKLGPTGTGTAQTARDIGASVIVGTNNDKTGYSLTQTFPTNFSSLVIDSSGRVNAFLIGILTSVFTEGATGRIAAAFKQFFNIATPAATMDHGVLLDTVTTATTATNLTNAAANGDFTSAMKTSLNAATPAVTVSDKTGFSLTAAYDPAKTAAQAGDTMKVSSGTGANQIDLTGGKVNVGKMNDQALLGTGQPTDLWRG